MSGISVGLVTDWNDDGSLKEHKLLMDIIGSEDFYGDMGRYAFHSQFWINLHHFLYQWSRADEGIGRGRQMIEVPERDHVAAEVMSYANRLLREQLANTVVLGDPAARLAVARASVGRG